MSLDRHFGIDMDTSMDTPEEFNKKVFVPGVEAKTALWVIERYSKEYHAKIADYRNQIDDVTREKMFPSLSGK